MNLRRWLTPGIGIKRWLLVVFVGLLLLALAFAHFAAPGRRATSSPAGWPGALIDVADPPVPAVRAARPDRRRRSGSSLVAVRGVPGHPRVRWTRSARADGDQPLVELIYQKRFLARGPRIVAIGGGTGLSTLLRGLKEHTSNLTAIVTVADDGGSSGVLRDELGIPPVGDIRNCIAALADAEPLMSELLQYRFPAATATATTARASAGTRSATC